MVRNLSREVRVIDWWFCGSLGEWPKQEECCSVIWEPKFLLEIFVLSLQPSRALGDMPSQLQAAFRLPFPIESSHLWLLDFAAIKRCQGEMNVWEQKRRL